MSAKNKLLSCLGALFALIIGLMTTVGYTNFKESSINNYTDKLNAEASLVSSAVEEKIARYFDVLHVMASQVKVNKTSIDNEADLLNTMKTMQRTLKVENAYLGLRNGETFATSNNGFIPNFNAKEKQREWFTRIMQGEDSIMTKPFKGSTGNTIMSLAVPVRKNGQTIAVLAMSLNLNEVTQFIDSLVANNQLFVTRGDGFIIASKYEEYIGQNIFDLRPSYAAYKDQKTSTHSYTFKGNDFFVSALKSEKLGWNIWSWDKWENINKASNANLISNLTIAIILTIIALAIAYTLITRLMYIPIGGEPSHISQIVERVADGNLADLDNKTGNETGINKSVISMVENLREVIQQINQSAQAIGQSSSLIAGSSASVNSSTQAQMLQLEQTSTAMNEMTVTVDEVAKNSLQASTTASQANENSEQGLQIVHEMNANIVSLVQGLDKVVTVTTNLEKETLNIGSILEVISGISEQTNLLALNAAIEAARAGEHGRGFAVVADEVRNLANRTKESTGEIQSMIQRLQEEAKRSVELMDVNMNDARETEEKSLVAATTIEEIQKSIAEIQDMNYQIATAAEEQTHVATEINSSIVEINSLSIATHKDSDNNDRLAAELSSVASELAESVKVFRL